MRRTIFPQQVLEITIVVMRALAVFCSRDEEANEEDNDDKEDERYGILESSPEPRDDCLIALFGGKLIIFFIPEVGERDHQEAEKSIERVQTVVDNLQGQNDIINSILARPVLSST